MAARRLRAAIGLLLCLLIAVPSSLLSQQKEKLTIEWMNSPESYRIGALPQWRWMPDGSLLWDDPAKPQAERRLEVMDPRTGKLRPFVDTAAALGSIRSILGEEKAPRRISMPSELDEKGTRGLYTIEGDLFALDLPGSKFLRVTSNPGPEKSPRMSPDGRSAAYVRGSDLYVSAHRRSSGAAADIGRNRQPAERNPLMAVLGGAVCPTGHGLLVVPGLQSHRVPADG